MPVTGAPDAGRGELADVIPRCVGALFLATHNHDCDYAYVFDYDYEIDYNVISPNPFCSYVSRSTGFTWVISQVLSLGFQKMTC